MYVAVVIGVCDCDCDKEGVLRPSTRLSFDSVQGYIRRCTQLCIEDYHNEINWLLGGNEVNWLLVVTK